ncbi:MAG: hypothetical protein ACRED1_08885 [Limisphaerales bacterium]
MTTITAMPIIGQRHSAKGASLQPPIATSKPEARSCAIAYVRKIIVADDALSVVEQYIFCSTVISINTAEATAETIVLVAAVRSGLALVAQQEGRSASKWSSHFPAAEEGAATAQGLAGAMEILAKKGEYFSRPAQDTTRTQRPARVRHPYRYPADSGLDRTAPERPGSATPAQSHCLVHR